MADLTYCYPSDTDWTGCYPPDKLAALDPEQKTFAESMAWMTLRALTAYRLATCPIKMRPAAAGCRGLPTWVEAPSATGMSISGSYLPAPFASAPYMPINSGGSWYNITCGCQGTCSCTHVPTIVLPSNAGGIDYIKIGAETLPPTAYRIDNGHLLVRTDGEKWPLRPDMLASEGEDGAFVISYYEGAPPDNIGKKVAGILAAEFLRACNGDSKCRLPRNVTNVTRAGISYDVKPDMFADGLTGILEVDSYVARFNPHRLSSRPRVVSPDSRRNRVQTGMFR